MVDQAPCKGFYKRYSFHTRNIHVNRAIPRRMATQQQTTKLCHHCHGCRQESRPDSWRGETRGSQRLDNLPKITELVRSKAQDQAQFLPAPKPAKHSTAWVYTRRPRNRESHGRQPGPESAARATETRFCWSTVKGRYCE